jgi:heme A synthase
MSSQVRPDPAVPAIEKRVRLAAILVCLGLLVQLITLVRTHPLAFMAFILIGCPLVLAGILLYLYSIVSHQPKLE